MCIDPTKAGIWDDWAEFGSAVALSSDGNMLVVGAPGENSSAVGINGNQADGSAPDAGAAYVFKRNGGGWSQQAYLKASNTQKGAEFGRTVAFSADASMLAIGASGESGNTVGVNGNVADYTAYVSGAVYIFDRSGDSWSQEAYVKPSNTGIDYYFGSAVALSGDGNTLAVGAYGESSGAVGIDGDQNDSSAPYAGAVYAFSRSGSGWTQQAYIKGSNTEKGDGFSASVALSKDGNTMAVGASGESSNAVGIDGNQADDSVPGAGAAYIFYRSGYRWSQRAYLKASNTRYPTEFGRSVTPFW